MEFNTTEITNIEFQYQDDDRTLKIFTNCENDVLLSTDDLMSEFKLKKAKLTRFEVIDAIKGRYFVKRNFNKLEISFDGLNINIIIE